MKIEVKYFGVIAEKTGKTRETIILPSITNIAAVKTAIVNKYPEIEKLIYKIAINQEILPEDNEITADCELAFLPPFAGG